MHSSLDVIAINHFPTSTLNDHAAGVIHVLLVHGSASYLVRSTLQSLFVRAVSHQEKMKVDDDVLAISKYANDSQD